MPDGLGVQWHMKLVLDTIASQRKSGSAIKFADPPQIYLSIRVCYSERISSILIAAAGIFEPGPKMAAAPSL